MSAVTHSARSSLDGCSGRGSDLSQFKVDIQPKRFKPLVSNSLTRTAADYAGQDFAMSFVLDERTPKPTSIGHERTLLRTEHYGRINSYCSHYRWNGCARSRGQQHDRRQHHHRNIGPLDLIEERRHKPYRDRAGNQPHRGSHHYHRYRPRTHNPRNIRSRCSQGNPYPNLPLPLHH